LTPAAFCLIKLYGETQAGFVGRVACGNVRAPGAVRFFHPQRVDGIETRMGKVVFFADRLYGVEHPLNLIHARVQFPAEFADVRDADHKDVGIGEAVPLRRTERESFEREVRVGQFVEQFARVRPHYSHHTIGVRHVSNRGVLFGQNVFMNPIIIARRLPRTGDDVVLVFGESCETEVGLVTAPHVEHATVNELADGYVGVIRREAVEHADGVAAFEHEFREGGLIPGRHVLSRGPMLGGHAIPPVLAAERIVHHRSGSVTTEPDRALDGHLAAEKCALRA
jgi:hypothetical protein